MAVPVLDLLVPGAGLTLRGRLGSGLACLVLAVLALSALILGRLLLSPALATPVTWWAVAAYVATGCVAAAIQVWLGRTQPALDAATLRLEHRRVAAAFLNDRGPEAIAAARAMAQRVKREPGAWRLLELVASRLGDAGEAAKAGKRARDLEREREDVAA